MIFSVLFMFFFNDTPTTDSYTYCPTLSLHDALPISPFSKRAFIGVSASVNVYGKGFGDYYYDIDPAGSAASGLPVYSDAGRKATAGKYQIGLAGAYALSGDLRKGFALVGGVQ